MEIAMACPLVVRSMAPYLDMQPEDLPTGAGHTVPTLLALALLERGHSLRLFTTSPDVEDERIFRGPSLEVSVVKQRKTGRGRDLFHKEVTGLARAMSRRKPPFIHAHWTYEFALGAIAAQVPTVATIHDLPWNVLRYFRDPYRVARLAMAYRVAARCAKYTAVSTDAARHFKRYFRPTADITIIPNFASEGLFERTFAGVTSPPRPVSFCTILQGWSVRKNAEAAIRAFGMVREQLPQARLIMFGDHYEPNGRAEAWARRNGLHAGIEFRGPLPYDQMISAVLEETDVVVHPSLDESFSMSALEGMALRKPVIAGKNTPGVREVLDYGRAGSLVDVRNPRAIAAEMLRLANDPGERARIAAVAHASAHSRFTTTRAVELYEGLYAAF